MEREGPGWGGGREKGGAGMGGKKGVDKYKECWKDLVENLLKKIKNRRN